MSDTDDQPPSAAARPPTRSIEAARRLSQLLARPLGSPAPAGETPEPYVPRSVRAAPPAPAPEPPHDTASAPPPPLPSDEPDLPWFDPPARPKADVEPVVPEPPREDAETAAPLAAPPAAQDEPRDPEPTDDDDLFARRESPRDLDEPVSPPPPAPDRVPEWAWPSVLDRAPEPAPEPRAELSAPPEPLLRPEPLVPPEPARAAPREPARPATAAPPLEPDATHALGNIRRLMLFSNLFMVVAIGAVLTVVGYRLFRTEPAPPPPPPTPAAPKPVLATIPNDMTLTLPRGARIVATAVAGDRLVITLEIDGGTEIRTFDIRTLQPTGRLMFGIVP
jgi:hypothetical protein